MLSRAKNCGSDLRILNICHVNQMIWQTTDIMAQFYGETASKY